MTLSATSAPTLTSLCLRADVENDDLLDRARVLLETPRGRQSIQFFCIHTLENGDPQYPPRAVQLAIRKNFPRLLRLFAEYGAWMGESDPHYGPTVFEKVESPLYLAAQAGSVQACQTLLDLGADPNRKNSSAWTPLHIAASEGHADLISLLESYGADIHAVNLQGNTPVLSLISKRGSDISDHVSDASQFSAYLKALDTLIELGAPLNDLEDSPLFYMMGPEPENAQWVRALLERGTDPNGRSALGWTPLHSAALEDYGSDVSACVELLLSYGANPSLVDHEGLSLGDDEFINPSCLSVVRAFEERKALDLITQPLRINDTDSDTNSSEDHQNIEQSTEAVPKSITSMGSAPTSKSRTL